VTDKEARDAARALGSENGTVHLYIPKPAGNELRDAITDMLAARATLSQRGMGHGSGGEEARRGMETRERAATEKARELISQLVDGAMVFVGGGAEQKEATLKDRLEAAAEIARKRLFPSFKDGDHPISAWDKAKRTAREGGEHPFSPIGHSGDVDQHPVGRTILNAIGAGRTGADVRRTFERVPYGWPVDAIDAALVGLVRAGKLRVTLNGEPTAPQALDNPAIGKATFQREDVDIAPRQRIALRGLIQRLVPVSSPDDLATPARQFLTELRKLGNSAGGEPPLPAPPRLALEDEAQSLSGNALLKLLLDRKSEVEGAIEAWKAREALKNQRLERWRIAQRLAHHAEGLTEAATALIDIRSIEEGRLLLDSQDPVSAPIARLRELLVQRLTTAHRQLSERVSAAIADLNDLPAFAELDLGQKEALLREVELIMPSTPQLNDDKALVDALDRRSLRSWSDAVDAVPARIVKAAEKAARQAEPTVQTVTLERATLRTAEEVEAWAERQKQKLLAAVARGPALIS
jgi:hypothetical protein